MPAATTINPSHLCLLEFPHDDFVEPPHEDDDLCNRIPHQVEREHHTRRAEPMPQRPQNGKEHDVAQQLIDGRGMVGNRGTGRKRRGMRVLHRPRQFRRIADDVAVHDIADAPNALRRQSEQRGGIERAPVRDLRAPAGYQERDHDAEDAAVERHAAFPGSQDAPGLLQVGPKRLLDDVVEPPAEKAGNGRRPKKRIDLIVIDAALVGVLANGPHACHDPQHVHQPIPAKRDGAKLKKDRVQVDGDDRGNEHVGLFL